jgi:hypothetical protein
MNMKLTSLVAGTILTFGSFYAFAAEEHLATAIEHAEAAAEASDAESVVEHAEAAKTPATEAHEHLNAGIKSLEDAIKHGKMGHADMAKKSAGEAVEHLKMAQ